MAQVLKGLGRATKRADTAPLLGKRLAYREILLAQARILVKHLLGELPRYEPFAVR